MCNSDFPVAIIETPYVLCRTNHWEFKVHWLSYDQLDIFGTVWIFSTSPFFLRTRKLYISVYLSSLIYVFREWFNFLLLLHCFSQIIPSMYGKVYTLTSKNKLLCLFEVDTLMSIFQNNKAQLHDLWYARVKTVFYDSILVSRFSVAYWSFCD